MEIIKGILEGIGLGKDVGGLFDENTGIFVGILVFMAFLVMLGVKLRIDRRREEAPTTSTSPQPRGEEVVERLPAEGLTITTAPTEGRIVVRHMALADADCQVVTTTDNGVRLEQTAPAMAWGPWEALGTHWQAVTLRITVHKPDGTLVDSQVRYRKP